MQFLLKVHPSWCTDDVATLWGINRQPKDTGLGWGNGKSFSKHQEGTGRGKPTHTRSSWCTDPAHCRRFRQGSRCCSPTVCEGTPSLLQQESTTARKEVQCFWLRIARSLRGCMALLLFPRGLTVHRLHWPQTPYVLYVQNSRSMVKLSATSTLIYLWIHKGLLTCAREGQLRYLHIVKSYHRQYAAGYWLQCRGCGPTTGCWGTSLLYFYLEFSTGRLPLWDTRCYTFP